mmetsp:Transcript_19789/g.32519  ORF Transcript_19789/g.32519 Transcript_19789/m.32519 type:complete len:587 (+) Transcript_19789:1250-3010(+)
MKLEIVLTVMACVASFTLGFDIDSSALVVDRELRGERVLVNGVDPRLVFSRYRTHWRAYSKKYYNRCFMGMKSQSRFAPWSNHCARPCGRGFVPKASALPNVCESMYFQRKESPQVYGKCVTGTENVNGKCLYIRCPRGYSVVGPYCGNTFWMNDAKHAHEQNRKFNPQLEFEELSGSTGYGYVAKIGAYDPKAPVKGHPTGFASIDREGYLTFVVQGLEINAQGGIHIHSGMECGSEAGGHWWKDGKADPWTTIQYKTNEYGFAVGKILIPEDAHDFANNAYHVVVLHSSTGSRIACGKLSTFLRNPLKKLALTEHKLEQVAADTLVAQVSTLPQGSSVIKGVAMLRANNVFSYNLQGLEKQKSGGIHIHRGVSCENVMGHNFPRDLDGWNSVKWESNQEGKSVGQIQLSESKGFYGFAKNAGRVVVIHDSTGKKVSCGVLETKDRARYGFLAVLKKYPNVAKDIRVPRGRVFLADDNMLRIRLAGGIANSDYSYHIHTGETCEDHAAVGGHFWNASGPDFWKNVKIQTNLLGKARGELDLSKEKFAHPFMQNTNHAVVVHQSDGTRVACGVLNKFQLEINNYFL